MLNLMFSRVIFQNRFKRSKVKWNILPKVHFQILQEFSKNPNEKANSFYVKSRTNFSDLVQNRKSQLFKNSWDFFIGKQGFEDSQKQEPFLLERREIEHHR